MQPWEFLPDGFEPPLRQEQFSIVWRANLGANALIGVVSSYLQAFQTLLDLGERWGLVMAEEAAARSLIRELFLYGDSGDVNLTPVRDVMSWHDEKRIYLSIQEILSRGTGDHPETIVEVPSVIRELASLSVPQLMGPPLRNEAITYRNPIEIIIAGSAFIAYGVVQVLRIARDWGARRRMANAAAVMAEAEAEQARTRADVIKYLGQEVTAGRLHVPPSELAKLVTSTDLQAIAQVAGPEPTLELPGSVSEIFGEPPHVNYSRDSLNPSTMRSARYFSLPPRAGKQNWQSARIRRRSSLIILPRRIGREPVNTSTANATDITFCHEPSAR